MPRLERERQAHELDLPTTPCLVPLADVRHTEQTEVRRIVWVPGHINDAAFIAEVVRNVRGVF